MHHNIHVCRVYMLDSIHVCRGNMLDIIHVCLVNMLDSILVCRVNELDSIHVCQVYVLDSTHVCQIDMKQRHCLIVPVFLRVRMCVWKIFLSLYCFILTHTFASLQLVTTISLLLCFLLPFRLSFFFKPRNYVRRVLRVFYWIRQAIRRVYVHLYVVELSRIAF